MARKRYETAFIPSSCSPSQSHHHQYPDVDSLLLSIDSFSVRDGEERSSRAEESTEFLHHHRWRSKSVNQDQFLLDKRGRETPISSTTYQNQPNQTGTGESEDDDKRREQGNSSSNIIRRGISQSTLETIATGHSRSVSPVRKGPISLSEPLHPRRHFQIMKSYASIQSSSGCSTNNSNSPVPSVARTTPNTLICKYSTSKVGPKVLTLTKLNSLDSSSDSIDSSEELKYCDKGGPKPPRTYKLLSPISDKSPLEPMATLGHVQRELGGCPGPRPVLPPPEFQLSNLPWEMPKLKRKLALLVDSGISLNSGDPEPRRWGLGESQSDTTSNQRKEKSVGSSGLGREVLQNDFGTVKMENVRVELARAPGGEEESLEEDEDDQPPSFRVPPPPPELPSGSLSLKPDRCKMTLDFGVGSRNGRNVELIGLGLPLDGQGWFYGAITRVEAEEILRVTKEGSFLVRNCESCVYNRYSLSLKSSRGFIHARIEPNPCSGKYWLGESPPMEEFGTVPLLVRHFMSHRLPMKGAEHVLLKFPVITNFL